MDPADSRLVERAQDAFAQVQASLGADERAWLIAVPVTAAVEAIDAQPPDLEFTAVTAEVEAVDAAVILEGGTDWAGKFWNLVLLELVPRALQASRPYRVPPEVRDILRAELERIVDACATGTTEADPLDDGDFRIDLGIASGRYLSFAYAVAELECRFPDWLPERAEGYPASGDRPWLQSHVRHGRGQQLKDPKAWAIGVGAVARFFLANPAYEGYFGFGWLADASLRDVSPHLAFVREQMEATGAIIVTLGDAPQEIVDIAISTSKTRRRMYEEGSWTPTIQCTIYTRDAFIAWAESLGVLQ